MINLGKLSYLVGFEFTKVKEGIVIHQWQYAMKVLKSFNMLNYNSTTTPSKIGLMLEKCQTSKLMKLGIRKLWTPYDILVTHDQL